MFDMIDEIQSQLRAGEDSCAEFMGASIDGLGRPGLRPEAIAETMVAFANLEGGCIFVGVEDGGLVQGIPESSVESVESLVGTTAREHCDPPIGFTNRTVRLAGCGTDDAIIVLVRVWKSLYFHRTTSGRYYKRSGICNHALDNAELRRFLELHRGRPGFDVQAVPGAVLEDLDLKQVESYLETYHGPVNSNAIKLTRIVAEVDGVQRPTVGGLLAFGRVPSKQLHSACISTAVYAGAEGTSDNLVDTDQFNGCVGYQIDAAVSFVARHLVKPIRTSVGGPDCPRFDLDAVFEAIVNAIMHRDYSISDRRTRIHLYADRIEIYSPGKLFGTLQIETLEYRVSTRNQLLVQFLSRIRSRCTNRTYWERRSDGVRKILRSSEQLSSRRPVYELLGEELRLTIWARDDPR